VLEVAERVALPRLDQREVDLEAPLEHVPAPVELARLLAFGDLRAVARRRVEARDAGPAGAQALGERALRVPLHLQAAVEGHLLERLALAAVGHDHLLDLPVADQGPDAEL